MKEPVERRHLQRLTRPDRTISSNVSSATCPSRIACKSDSTLISTTQTESTNCLASPAQKHSSRPPRCANTSRRSTQPVRSRAICANGRSPASKASSNTIGQLCTALLSVKPSTLVAEDRPA
uniref:(northern house mosquito) hypothetical protein n=1 Tax=Culex pipiens TaxID=7175 RepID=A0A8D8J4A9_CULPI